MRYLNTYNLSVARNLINKGIINQNNTQYYKLFYYSRELIHFWGFYYLTIYAVFYFKCF